MDKRIEKTRAALKTAFFQLRSKKDLEKITVKELCEAADINKSTFYTHYIDIYDLSDSLTRETINKIVAELPQDNNYDFTNPELFTVDITYAFAKYRNELNILFSGRSLQSFGSILEKEIKKLIFKQYPQLSDNAAFNVLLSYCIHGAYNAQMSNPEVPLEVITAILRKILQQIQPLFTYGKKQ